MKDQKVMWAWVGAVVVVLIIVAVVVWPRVQIPSASAPASTSGPSPVYAPQGQLVPEFPQQLILDPAATVSGSYGINYATSTNQYTAEFNSSESMAAMFDDYQQYFSGNGWTLTGTITNHAAFEELSASASSSQVQVVISPTAQGSSVTVTYLAQ